MLQEIIFAATCNAISNRQHIIYKRRPFFQTKLVNLWNKPLHFSIPPRISQQVLPFLFILQQYKFPLKLWTLFFNPQAGLEPSVLWRTHGRCGEFPKSVKTKYQIKLFKPMTSAFLSYSHFAYVHFAYRSVSIHWSCQLREPSDHQE
jgi:hypothetical protein